ncbi:MAG TPA: AraC family transcriptional regulator, partial [Chitinophagaceae bacterium]|nr:AraC family transcriptional regulator [Chitinophagaceae bacterium]
ALQMANALLEHAQSEQERARSFLLIATLHARSGNTLNAIRYAMEGENLAKENSLKDVQMRAAGLLSTTFRSAGLHAEAKKYLDIVQRNNNTIKNPEIQMMIHQERAYVALDKRDYAQVIKQAQNAIEIYSTIKPTPGGYISEGINGLLMGLALHRDGNHLAAEAYLKHADSVLKHSNTELKGFIHGALGELYLNTNRYALAKNHLDSALSYTIKSNNFNLKFDVYNSLYDYYEHQGNVDQMLLYKKYATEIREQLIRSNLSISNALTEKYDHDIDNKQRKNIFLISLSSILFVSIVCIIVLSRRNSVKQRNKYLAYIEILQHNYNSGPDQLLLAEYHAEIPVPHESPTLLAPDTSDEYLKHAAPHVFATSEEEEIMLAEQDLPVEKTEGNRATNNQTNVLLPETEERILRDLRRLEVKKFYLKSDINLSQLSAKLKANTKYVSFVINKYKKKDFNNYINELRINYIIQKLQVDNQYLDYKISYLAEECGFSSHSKFATIFKSVTGISPSVFIKNIRLDRSSV